MPFTAEEDPNSGGEEEEGAQMEAGTSELHRQHLIQTLQSLHYIKSLRPVSR